MKYPLIWELDISNSGTVITYSLEGAVQTAFDCSCLIRHSPVLLYKRSLFLGIPYKKTLCAVLSNGKLLDGYGDATIADLIHKIFIKLKIKRREIAEKECIHCNPEMISKT